MQLRVMGLYFPIPRRWSWEEFWRIRKTTSEQILYNFPSFAPPPRNEPVTEKWMINVMDSFLLEYKEVPDPAVVATRRFCKLIIDMLTAFPEWTTHSHPIHGLAFQIDQGPTIHQIFGYFDRIQWFPAHRILDFEEMFSTRFWAGYKVLSREYSSARGRQHFIHYWRTFGIPTPHPRA